VQRTADRHHIEFADVARKGFSLAFD
jgi:hypothetical protein